MTTRTLSYVQYWIPRITNSIGYMISTQIFFKQKQLFAECLFSANTPGFKNIYIDLAIAGVAQWTECQPTNSKVAGSIPSQSTCLGSWPGPQ